MDMTWQFGDRKHGAGRCIRAALVRFCNAHKRDSTAICAIPLTAAAHQGGVRSGSPTYATWTWHGRLSGKSGFLCDNQQPPS